MHAFDMEAEIASLQEALVTTIAEKEEALSRVELLTSAVEDLESRLNSAESETSSLLEETAVLVYLICLMHILEDLFPIYLSNPKCFDIMKFCCVSL